MNPENSSTPGEPAPASPSSRTRADRSATGWARDNTPLAAPEVLPAEVASPKPVRGRLAARKKLEEEQESSTDVKVSSDANNAPSRNSIAADNTKPDNLSPQPRIDSTAVTMAEAGSSPELAFDRKGDRGVAEWGRDAPVAASAGGNSSLYTLLSGGLLTAGLVSNVGGGASSASNSTASVFKVVVIDGPIRNADVYVGTTKVGKTDQSGVMVLTTKPEAGVISVVGGENIDTGLPNTLTLKSKASFMQDGTIVISPVTTLVAEMVEKGLSESVAQTRVKAALGISSAIDVNTYDPFASVHVNTSDGLKVMKAGAQLAAIGSSTSFEAKAYTDLASYLVSNSGATTLDLSNPSTLQMVYSPLNPLAMEELNNVVLANAAIMSAADAAKVATAQKSEATPKILGLNVDSGSSQTDEYTNNSDLFITGLNAGAIVELSVDGGLTWVAKSNFAPADGTYSVIARLHYGNGVKTASSEAFSFTLDTVLPASPQLALSVDTGASGDLITSNAAIIISGQTTGKILQYSSDNVTWSTTQPAASEGKNDFYARQSNPLSGNASLVTKLSFVLDTKAEPGTMGLGVNTSDVTYDTGASATDGVTSNNRPQLAGQTEAGATSVTVNLAGQSYLVTDLRSNGSWTLDLPSTVQLADGTYTPTVVVKDAAGNTSAAMTMLPIVIDTAAPTMLTAQLATTSDAGFSSDDGFTNINQPEITGVTEAFATVSVDLGLDNPLVTQADKNGKWSVVVSTPLDDDDYSPSITITDKAGNVSEPIEGTPFTVQAIGPNEDTPTTLVDDETIDTGISSTDGITSNVLPTLTGTLETPAKGDVTSTLVIVSFAGRTYFTQPDDTGLWSIQIPEGNELEDGTYVPGITYIDPAGNIVRTQGQPVIIDTTAPDTDTVTADLVHDAQSDTGLSSTDGITKNNSPWIEGTADPFSRVMVDLNGTQLEEVEANANGYWKVQADGLDDGDYTLQITVTDLAGNVSDPLDADTTFTVLTAEPDAPTGNLVHDDVSDTGFSIDDSLTKNNRPDFEGTATANAEVKLSFKTSDNLTLAFTTLADDNGDWVLKLDKSLPDGEYTPIVSITDVAGNVGETELEPLVIDTTPPDAGTVTAKLTQDEDNDTGISDADGITNNNAATLTGTSDANSQIRVNLAGTDFTTESDEDGIWSITLDALDDGTYTPVIYVTDAAGNESAATGINGTPFTIDTTAPDTGTANLVHTAVNDTGINPEDGLTNNTSPWFEGTAEAYSHITLDLNGSTFETDADKNGKWKVQAEGLDDGEYTPLIKVADRAGNSSEEIEGEPFTILTAVPDEPSGNLVQDDTNDTGVAIDDNITKNNAPAFEGTAAPDAEVTLKFITVGGQSLSFTSTADADGNWKLQLDRPLPDGVYIPMASVTDAAGNTSSAELDPLTIDTTAPNSQSVTLALTSDADNDTGVSDNDGITNNNSATLTGKADANSQIRVNLAGTDFTTESDEDGNWSITLDALDDGTYTPVIYVADAAGNESASSGINGTPFTIDTQAPNVLTGGLLHDATNDTGISANDGITKNSQPKLAGTTEAFATVSVDFGDITYDTQADGLGHWTLTPKNPLPDNLDGYTPLITVTDKAGNVSDEIEGDLVIIKTSVTVASGGLTQDDVNDTGASTDDGITNNNRPSLSGLADAGSAVVVTLNGQTYNTKSNEDGEWTIETTAVLPDGTYTPQVVVTDAAGNSTSFNANPITIDTVAGMSGGDTGTHQVFKVGFPVNFNPFLAGVSSVDATVEDYSGNLPDGLSIDSNGHIVGTPLAAGSTWLLVTANDLAGNSASQYLQFTVAASEKNASSSILSITSPDPEKAGLYVGTAGDDRLNVYASSKDVILGGAGNDLFQLFRPESLDFSRLDGGSGNDQVNFSGTDLEFDFSVFNNPDGSGQVVERIESFYFLGSSSDITVTASDLFHLRSDILDVDGQHQLVRFLSGPLNKGTVTMEGLTQVGGINAWGASGAITSGASNDKFTKFTGTYTDSSGDHLVELLIQNGLTAA